MKQRRFHLAKGLCGLFVPVSIGLGMCASAGSVAGDGGDARPSPSPLGREIPTDRGGTESGAGAPRPAAPREPEGVLTLPQALELALMHSPELAASAHGVRAAAGALRQAGVPPNPELQLEAEEWGGTDARRGYDAAETTLQLSQTVELGGKRDKRRRVARSEARLSGWEYETRRLEVFASTTKAFVDVLRAQEMLALAESSLAMARDVHKAATDRVTSGKVPALEATKAGIELADARIVRDRAGRELDMARRQLAASWGGTEPVFREAGGVLDLVGDVPPLEAVVARLDEVPGVARWDEEVRLASESLALAESARIPDLGVSVGIRRFEEDGTGAGVAGLSVPLPLFDRNAGGILAAKHRLARAEHERRAARVRARTDLTEAHLRLETARAEAAAIQAELLPGARQAFEAAQQGYAEGKFGYLEVLDAQRTLGEAKARHLEALAACHRAAADVERLAGAPLKILREDAP